jgi:UDP-N-acetylmuramate: L-alanyl-gamma-D-glutamyl-meso-diaminopimelate ligase
MKVHFIAIGGSAMHNLAIALHKKGYEISGSDDEIFEPSKGRLKKYGLLPKKIGWSTDFIDNSIDAIILGMHAKPDNPELKQAQKLGLKIYSYPEYIYEQAKDKMRLVVAGSHGKTSITSMVLHVLQKQEIDFDYMVGAQLEGFETMVKLSDAPIMVIEGDEYLSSPIDRRPKIFWYKPQVTVISGIAWDHINVFPTFENYLSQFEQYIKSLPQNAKLIYYQGDEQLKELTDSARADIDKIPYLAHDSEIVAEKTNLKTNGGLKPVHVFGEHNLQNLNAALLLCQTAGVEKEAFYDAIQSFKGASKRLELIAENEGCIIYKDYAHSPSKLKATTAAVKKQYQNRKLIACMELHTFSSLTKEFLAEYSGSMNAADEAIVYFNPKAIEHKGLDMLGKEDIRQAFLPSEVNVFDQSEEVQTHLRETELDNTVVLLMTSGNFDGINLNKFAQELISN